VIADLERIRQIGRNEANGQQQLREISEAFFDARWPGVQHLINNQYGFTTGLRLKEVDQLYASQFQSSQKTPNETPNETTEEQRMAFKVS
jgi:hypothetical protein